MGHPYIKIVAIACFISMFVFLFGSCAHPPRSYVRKLSTGFESKPENCELVVYELDTQIPVNNRTVGTVVVQNDILALGCDNDKMLDLAKKAACNLGAEGLVITKYVKQSFHADCRIEANAVKFVTSSSAPQAQMMTEGKIGRAVKIFKHGEPDKWFVETPGLIGGYPSENDYKLRGMCTGKNLDSLDINVYVVTPHFGFWPLIEYVKPYDLEYAEDIEGNQFELDGDSGGIYPHAGAMEYLVIIREDYLESHRETPIEMKLIGRGGTIDVNITPQAINAFLKALNTYLASE
jgi:hypothetical protein